MSIANIKLPTEEINLLCQYTGQKTGQKAVQTALLYYLKEARQRRISQILPKISFHKGFNPLRLRRRER
ncbi:MAG: hypothetical protein HY073_03140 [Deltaproteobacteria bacterium]|nr:hypothetical protein [Deltaproteobacteria bacterium]